VSFEGKVDEGYRHEKDYRRRETIKMISSTTALGSHLLREIAAEECSLEDVSSLPFFTFSHITILCFQPITSVIP